MGSDPLKDLVRGLGLAIGFSMITMNYYHYVTILVVVLCTLVHKKPSTTLRHLYSSLVIATMATENREARAIAVVALCLPELKYDDWSRSALTGVIIASTGNQLSVALALSIQVLKAMVDMETFNHSKVNSVSRYVSHVEEYQKTLEPGSQEFCIIANHKHNMREKENDLKSGKQCVRTFKSHEDIIPKELIHHYEAMKKECGKIEEIESFLTCLTKVMTLTAVCTNIVCHAGVSSIKQVAGESSEKPPGKEAEPAEKEDVSSTSESSGEQVDGYKDLEEASKDICCTINKLNCANLSNPSRMRAGQLIKSLSNLDDNLYSVDNQRALSYARALTSDAKYLAKVDESTFTAVEISEPLKWPKIFADTSRELRVSIDNLYKTCYDVSIAVAPQYQIIQASSCFDRLRGKYHKDKFKAADNLRGDFDSMLAKVNKTLRDFHKEIAQTDYIVKVQYTIENPFPLEHEPCGDKTVQIKARNRAADEFIPLKDLVDQSGKKMMECDHYLVELRDTYFSDAVDKSIDGKLKDGTSLSGDTTSLKDLINTNTRLAWGAIKDPRKEMPPTDGVVGPVWSALNAQHSQLSLIHTSGPLLEFHFRSLYDYLIRVTQLIHSSKTVRKATVAAKSDSWRDRLRQLVPGNPDIAVPNQRFSSAMKSIAEHIANELESSKGCIMLRQRMIIFKEIAWKQADLAIRTNNSSKSTTWEFLMSLSALIEDIETEVTEAENETVGNIEKKAHLRCEF